MDNLVPPRLTRIRAKASPDHALEPPPNTTPSDVTWASKLTVILEYKVASAGQEGVNVWKARFVPLVSLSTLKKPGEITHCRTMLAVFPWLSVQV